MKYFNFKLNNKIDQLMLSLKHFLLVNANLQIKFIP